MPNSTSPSTSTRMSSPSSAKGPKPRVSRSVSSSTTSSEKTSTCSKHWSSRAGRLGPARNTHRLPPSEHPRSPPEDRLLHEFPVPGGHEVIDVAEARLEEEGHVG